MARAGESMSSSMLGECINDSRHPTRHSCVIVEGADGIFGLPK